MRLRSTALPKTADELRRIGSLRGSWLLTGVQVDDESAIKPLHGRMRTLKDFTSTEWFLRWLRFFITTFFREAVSTSEPFFIIFHISAKKSFFARYCVIFLHCSYWPCGRTILRWTWPFHSEWLLRIWCKNCDCLSPYPLGRESGLFYHL